MGNRWVLETILLYRLGWDLYILAVIGRWLLCSGGCLLRFYCTQNSNIDLFSRALTNYDYTYVIVCVRTYVHIHVYVRTYEYGMHVP